MSIHSLPARHLCVKAIIRIFLSFRQVNFPAFVFETKISCAEMIDTLLKIYAGSVRRKTTRDQQRCCQLTDGMGDGQFNNEQPNEFLDKTAPKTLN